MNCKFCDALLEDGVTLCPQCGKENEQIPEAVVEEVNQEIAEETVQEEIQEVAEEITEETTEEETEESEEETVEETAEEQPKKKRKLWVSIVAIVCIVALAATLVGSVIYGSRAKKGTSYSVSDAKAVKERQTVVATVGDQTLTNSELQVYYWQAVSDFYNYYGYYMDMSTLGLDLEKPLDEQYYDEANGVTWQSYFVETALNTWHRYAALTILGKEAGYELDAESLAYLDDVPNQLEELAVSYGYPDASTMLAEDMGPASDVEGYMRFIRMNFYVSQYFDSLYESISPSDAELEKYYAENTAALNEMGIVKDDKRYVDVRHILFCPESAAETDTFTDAEWEACRQKAQALLDQWLAGDKTEESFALLAMEHSEDPGSQAEGGLYTEVAMGDMVAPFENWCFDANRKPGDYGLVQTDYGYHIMYFVDTELAWMTDLRSQMVNDHSTGLVESGMAQNPLKTDYKKIVLGEAATVDETDPVVE